MEPRAALFLYPVSSESYKRTSKSTQFTGAFFCHLDFYNMWKLIVVTEVNPPQQIGPWQVYNVNTLAFIFHDCPGAGHVEVT